MLFLKKQAFHEKKITGLARANCILSRIVSVLDVYSIETQLTYTDLSIAKAI